MYCDHSGPQWTTVDHSVLILLNMSVLTAGNGNLSTHHMREVQAARLRLCCRLCCSGPGERSAGVDRSIPPGPPPGSPGRREPRTRLSSAPSDPQLAGLGSRILHYGGNQLYLVLETSPPIRPFIIFHNQQLFSRFSLHTPSLELKLKNT